MTDQLPEAFVKRVKTQLGKELPSFLAAMEEPPIRGIRRNPFRMPDRRDLREALEPVPWEPNGWALRAESQAGIRVAHEAGSYYLQEPGAMLPAAVMDARPGEIILDLCAAPGGKSTRMGCDLRGEGLLICNEPVPKRAAVLSRNMERMGIENAVVTCAWPDQLAARWPEGFDGVMVDAPCSGEGMFRRDEGARAEWSPERAEGCVRRQREILTAAAKMVRPGGRLVYATCTFHPAENEDQVGWFLKEHPDFEKEPFALPGAEGRDGTFTVWPHRSLGEGQFVALLRRKGTGKARITDGSAAFRIPKDAERLWAASNLGMNRPNAQFGSSLVRLEYIPDLEGIKVLRLGLHLAEIRGKNLLPDHAAALAMTRPEGPERILTDAEALRYLAGESIPGDEKGWMLMTWQNLVLGWGKGSDGNIRNHYPKGLRNGKLII